MGHASRAKRIGIYVDAFNVYYGGRARFGGEIVGWRWLDLAGLSKSLISRSGLAGGEISTLWYCTAERSRDSDPNSLSRQRAYIGALAVDPLVKVELGSFVIVEKRGLLLRGSQSRKRKSMPAEPDCFKIASEYQQIFERTDEGILTRIRTFEEKGSDVNVGSRLLHDVLLNKVDGVIVFSNDADLRLPLQIARQHVPVGLVNPGLRQLAHHLHGESSEGVGGHWWYKLTGSDFQKFQLPDIVGGFQKPVGW